MTKRRSRWLIGAMVTGMVAAAVLLALAALLDVPGLQFLAVGLIGGVLLARGIWMTL